MNAVVPLSDSAVAQVAPTRETILRAESYLRQFDQIGCPLKHHFAPGTYGREIFLPADTFVVGKIHKHAHLNIVSRGHCWVATEFGVREIDATQGPVTFASEAGAKRALYVQEDTVWTTIHLTNSTDLAEIEREIIAPTFEDLDAFLAGARNQIESALVREGRVVTSLGSPLQLPEAQP